jgi:ankyrin repeat protein
MSSRTPNDILLRRVTRSSTSSNTISKKDSITNMKTSTRLKDIFINNKQREELPRGKSNIVYTLQCTIINFPRVVTYLLEEKKAGLNPDLIRDHKLRTPLLVACAAGQAAVVRQLIRWGSDVNNAMGDIVGNKPLDLAVISNNVDTVLALLEAGAKISPSNNINVQADDGLPLPVRLRAATRTPLHLANSRLDMLIKQSEQSTLIKSDTIDQVLQVLHCCWIAAFIYTKLLQHR